MGSDTPGDHGGVTAAYGLTLDTMKCLNLDLNNDGVVDKNDLSLVTKDVAHTAFIKYFWDSIDADNLPGGIDLIATDITYNSGSHKWHQFQREGYGRLGTCTEINDLVQRRIQFYNWQAKNVIGQSKFLDGWTARAERSGEEAKKCVGVTT